MFHSAIMWIIDAIIAAAVGRSPQGLRSPFDVGTPNSSASSNLKDGWSAWR
jgi:hypothetical protein